MVRRTPDTIFIGLQAPLNGMWEGTGSSVVKCTGIGVDHDNMDAPVILNRDTGHILACGPYCLH